MWVLTIHYHQSKRCNSLGASFTIHMLEQKRERERERERVGTFFVFDNKKHIYKCWIFTASNISWPEGCPSISTTVNHLWFVPFTLTLLENINMSSIVSPFQRGFLGCGKSQGTQDCSENIGTQRWRTSRWYQSLVVDIWKASLVPCVPFVRGTCVCCGYLGVQFGSMTKQYIYKIISTYDSICT